MSFIAHVLSTEPDDIHIRRMILIIVLYISSNKWTQREWLLMHARKLANVSGYTLGSATHMKIQLELQIWERAKKLMIFQLLLPAPS